MNKLQGMDMSSEALILGLDVGGTKTAVVLGTRQARILWRKQFPTRPERGFEATFGEMLAVLEEALGMARREVVALSVSIGGPMRALQGLIQSPPHLPGWDDIPLKDLLAQQFALPVYVEHDGNAGALAEFYFGAGKGCRNLIFITMGTGFGAGLILEGRLYRGTSDAAGEIGHIRIAEEGPVGFGKAGSLEGFCSGDGIARLAQVMYPQKWQSATTVIELYEDFKRGSAEVRAVFERVSFHLGRGLAMLADVLNPERIILGGIGMRLFDTLVVPAKRVFEAEALPQAASACEIVPAQLGEAIGDVASLCAALDQGKLLLG